MPIEDLSLEELIALQDRADMELELEQPSG